MPIFSIGEAAPAWSELDGFRLLDMSKEGQTEFDLSAARNRVLVTQGHVLLRCGSQAQALVAGQFFDLAGRAGATATVELVTGVSQAAHLYGTWGDELGGCGLFSVNSAPDRVDTGDAVNYPKDTGFDRHYHDCDEYWIVLSGRGEVVVDESHYDVGPGDCVATGCGFHHDFPRVQEPVTAIYFETTLRGRKRAGHLWNHTHGLAQPHRGRG